MATSSSPPPVHEAFGFDGKLAQFVDLVKRGIKRLYRADNDDLRALRAMAGITGSTTYLPLSDIVVRCEAERLLTPMLLSRYNGARQPSWAFISLGGDLGNTLERAPEFYLSAFRRKVYAVLEKLELHAVFVIEVQALTNFPARGHGATLMLNAHAVAWTNRPFDAGAAQENLRGAMPVTFHMHPVDIKPTADLEAHTRRCRYMLKPPSAGKIMHKVDGREGYAVEFKQAEIRPDIAARLLEVMSQISFSEAVGGAGEGKAVAAAFRRQLKTWDAQRPRGAKQRPRIDGVEEAAAVWARVRRDNPGRVERQPALLHRSGAVSWPTRWQLIAGPEVRRWTPRAKLTI